MPPFCPVPLQSKTGPTKTLPWPHAAFPRSAWEQESREGILVMAGGCSPSVPPLSPLSPELCFLLAWMLKFKVKMEAPRLAVPAPGVPVEAMGPDGPGSTWGRWVRFLQLPATAFSSPVVFFSLSVCSSPLPVPRVLLDLPSCQCRAAAYANRCELSAEKQQRMVTAHSPYDPPTTGSALVGGMLGARPFPQPRLLSPGRATKLG